VEEGRFQLVQSTDISAATAATDPEVQQQPEKEEGGDAADMEGTESAADRISDFVRRLCAAAVADGCEGLMAKSLDGPTSIYAPAKRSETSWIKLKRDYLAAEGMGDTLDVVPIAAWRGSGRKAGWLSPFLVAVWNPETEEYEALCKVMTGFTDVQFRSFTERFTSRSRGKDKGVPTDYRIPENLRGAPFIFDPQVVWELQGAELTISPTYGAALGLVDPAKGLSLRFPRFIRERPDKTPEQATTSEAIAQIYRAQARRVSSGGQDDGVDSS
jgi:DNA ligase-1